MTAPFLRLSGVTKRYQGHRGIADLSLEVSAGESVVVVGPSGSGKTTLLRVIAGLERPDAGEIWLDGRIVAKPKRNTVPANERGIGFVFQDLALWPHLTVRGNLDFVAKSANVEKRLRLARIHDALLSGAASCFRCGGITVSIGRATYCSARDATPSSCFRCMTKWTRRTTSLVNSNGSPWNR